MFLNAFLQIFVISSLGKPCPCSVLASLSLPAVSYVCVLRLILLSFCSSGSNVYIWDFFLHFPVVRGVTYLTLGEPNLSRRELASWWGNLKCFSVTNQIRLGHWESFLLKFKTSPSSTDYLLPTRLENRTWEPSEPLFSFYTINITSLHLHPRRISFCSTRLLNNPLCLFFPLKRKLCTHLIWTPLRF